MDSRHKGEQPRTVPVYSLRHIDEFSVQSNVMSPQATIPRGKRRHKYKGILAEPMVLRPKITPSGADPECPPDGWVASGRSLEGWRRVVLEARRADWIASCEGQREYAERVAALGDDLGIDRSPQGWGRDFTLGLVLRYEAKHLCASGPTYSRLFAKYGIDPDQPEADFMLGLAIAHEHVPGMKYKHPKPIKGRHETIDLIRLVMATAAVRHHVGSGRMPVSDREVAEILRDERRLSKIIPPAAASGVVKMKGNEGGWLSETVLRGYLRQMRTAWPDVLARRATAFQEQLVREVHPFFLREQRRLDRERAGQNMTAD